MAVFSRCLVVLFALCTGGCAIFAPSEKFGARPATFTELEGWASDDHAQALTGFLATCPFFEKAAQPATSGSGLAVSSALWRSLCTDARASQADARGFFERRFVPYRIHNHGREEGLFTGYYEPLLYGSYRRGGDFQYPLYALPPDIREGTPYYTHAEINNGALSGRRLELLWVDDPVMRFFLQIQGSGRIKLMNGKIVSVGYAGKNGHPYRSIGKAAGEQGLIPKEEIHFFTLRQWLYQNPDRAFALMEENPSYVFFRVNPVMGAVGAAGAILAPMRSLAVDSRYIPYGLPLYVETQLAAEPQREPKAFRRLMIAQDTGGAIRGPVRGDIFFGAGDDAEYYAGYMAHRGVYTLLVPKEIERQINP